MLSSVTTIGCAVVVDWVVMTVVDTSTCGSAVSREVTLTVAVIACGSAVVFVTLQRSLPSKYRGGVRPFRRDCAVQLGAAARGSALQRVGDGLDVVQCLSRCRDCGPWLGWSCQGDQHDGLNLHRGFGSESWIGLWMNGKGCTESLFENVSCWQAGPVGLNTGDHARNQGISSTESCPRSSRSAIEAATALLGLIRSKI